MHECTLGERKPIGETELGMPISEGIELIVLSNLKSLVAASKENMLWYVDILRADLTLVELGYTADVIT